MARESSGNRRILTNVAAGLVGGLLASYVMEEFQHGIERFVRGTGAAEGGGGQQHRTPQTEPATYKAADAVTKTVTGHPLPEEKKPAGGALVHYAFGGAVGAMYGAAAAQNEEVTAWAGVPFGATVWLLADELGVPLAGLSRKPTDYPLASHASALATHLVYGATTETVRRLLMLAVKNR